MIFDNNTNFIQGWEKIANFYLELISALNPLTHIVQELCLLLSNLAPCRLPAIAADRDYNDMKHVVKDHCPVLKDKEGKKEKKKKDFPTDPT